MGASREEWLERFAAELGVAPPSPAETEALLALTGVAAHASERTAAPLSAWLVGRAGLSPAEAQGVAERLADALAAGAASER